MNIPELANQKLPTLAGALTDLLHYIAFMVQQFSMVNVII